MQSPEIVLILNPKSGSNDENVTETVRKTLEQSGRAFLCLETDPERGAAPAVEQAKELGAQTVIACGGDGTVMSAVNALGKVEADLKLAIVPLGTANLLARALSVPLDAEDALAVALEGDEKRIDLGSCEDTLFALGLGLGLTEKLVSGASAEEKEKIGKWAYVKALLAEVGANPTTFTYTIDGGEEQQAPGVAVVVANAGTLSGNVEFAPGAKMDDGKLNLVILHRLNGRDLVRLAWKTLRGTMKDDGAVTVLAGKSIEIKTNPPLDLQIDGEVVELHPPLKVEVRPGALRVAVPNEEQSASIAEKLAKAVSEVQQEIKAPGKTLPLLPRWAWGVVAVLTVAGAFIWKTRKSR